MLALLDTQRSDGTLQEVGGGLVAPLDSLSGKMITPLFSAAIFNHLANPACGEVVAEQQEN